MSLAGVFGKNDGYTQGLLAKATAGFGAELFEGPHSFDIGGKQILVVHDLNDATAGAIERHAFVIHGHTHQPEHKVRDDTMLVNPGEACGWLYGAPTAAILDIETRQVEMIKLTEPEWKF